MNNMLKIGITSRVVEAETYTEKRDAISQVWTTFTQKINGMPIYIPNSLLDVESFSKELKIDALVLSGGDNVGFPPEREKTGRKPSVCHEPRPKTSRAPDDPSDQRFRGHGHRLTRSSRRHLRYHPDVRRRRALSMAMGPGRSGKSSYPRASLPGRGVAGE